VAKLVEHQLDKISKYSKDITLLFSFFIIFGAIGPTARAMIIDLKEIIPILIVVLIMNVVLVALTFLISRRIREIHNKIVLTLLNYKNSILGIIIASNVNSIVTLAVIVFALMQNVVLAIMFKFFDRYEKKVIHKL